MEQLTIRTRSALRSGSRVSRYGRVSKQKESIDTENSLYSQRPSVLKCNKRRKRSRLYHRAKSRVAVESAARVAVDTLVPEPSSLSSSQLTQKKDISAMDNPELKKMLKDADEARQVLVARGFIAEWNARDMKTAVWVDQVELIPFGEYQPGTDLGLELPSVHWKVARAKIVSNVQHYRRISGRPFTSRPRLTHTIKLDFERPLLLHCWNRALHDKPKPGSRVFMSEGKRKRRLVARVSSVEDADYKVAPYRVYGDEWEAYMDNSNLPIPALVFK